MNESKKAILVVSFGTSYDETREKTISAIEKKIKERFSDYPVYSAWTSRKIIEKLRDTRGEHIMTVPEALEQMKADGITDVYIQPTHIINGIEYTIMRTEAHSFKNHFAKITFGNALLTTKEDVDFVIDAVLRLFGNISEKQALVFMGHGTSHYSNAIYAAIEYILRDRDINNVFMGTVESYPSIEQVKKNVAKYGPEEIILAPFMFVAGDHANNDMAGDDDDSWLSQFKEEGYKVKTVIRGLGECEEIQNRYVQRLEEMLSEEK